MSAGRFKIGAGKACFTQSSWRNCVSGTTQGPLASQNFIQQHALQGFVKYAKGASRGFPRVANAMNHHRNDNQQPDWAGCTKMLNPSCWSSDSLAALVRTKVEQVSHGTTEGSAHVPVGTTDKKVAQLGLPVAAALPALSLDWSQMEWLAQISPQLETASSGAALASALGFSSSLFQSLTLEFALPVLAGAVIPFGLVRALRPMHSKLGGRSGEAAKGGLEAMYLVGGPMCYLALVVAGSVAGFGSHFILETFLFASVPFVLRSATRTFSMSKSYFFL